MFSLFGKKKREELARLQQIQLEQENAKRVEECNDALDCFLYFLGYIARESVNKEELTRLIAGGITPDALVDNIYGRIERKDGIKLGTQFLINRPFTVKLTQSYMERHVYIIGRSGSGKTNILRTMLLQHIDAGNGVGVLAPEQEMIIEEILPYIRDDRINDVIYINPSDIEHPISLNPLHLEPGEDIDLKVDDLLTIFERIMGDITHRMSEILRQTFYALLERKGSTLLDIPRLLSREDGSFRAQIIRSTEDEQTREFFSQTYPHYPREASTPIITRINRLVRPKLTRTLLCQPGQSLNFRRAMDEGKIILVNLSDGVIGEQTAQLLGQLIVSKIQMAVMSRADTPEAERRPFYLYLDEFQTFVGVAGTSYARILSRARKYKLSVILAHQQTGQIPLELLREILGNVSTVVCFNVSSFDAARFAQEYLIEDVETKKLSGISPYELLNLKTGEAYIKIGRQSFFMQTHLLPKVINDDLVADIIDASRNNYAGNHNGNKPPPRNSWKPPGLPQAHDDDDDDFDPSKVF